MLEFNKYEDVTHCICGVYRASIVALRRNPRHHRMLGGRHGLRWFFRHFNSSYHYHLCDHPRSLYCKAYGAEYSYLKVALSRFNFPFSFSYPSPLPPVVGWVLASSCVFGSHAHLLSGCCDSPSFHVPLKAPHFSTHNGSSPHSPHMRTGSQTTTLATTIGYVCMKYLCMYEISLISLATMDELVNHSTLTIYSYISFLICRCRKRILLIVLGDGTLHLHIAYGYRDLFQALNDQILKYISLSLSLFLVPKSVPSQLWKLLITSVLGKTS